MKEGLIHRLLGLRGVQVVTAIQEEEKNIVIRENQKVIKVEKLVQAEVMKVELEELDLTLKLIMDWNPEVLKQSIYPQPKEE